MYRKLCIWSEAKKVLNETLIHLQPYNVRGLQPKQERKCQKLSIKKNKRAKLQTHHLWCMYYMGGIIKPLVYYSQQGSKLKFT